MKRFSVFAAFFVSILPQLGLGQNCRPEAQIIARITEVESDSLTFCRARIEAGSVNFYASSEVCPLAQSQVIAQGIEFPLQFGHHCELAVGQEISGVLVEQNGFIRLD